MIQVSVSVGEYDDYRNSFQSQEQRDEVSVKKVNMAVAAKAWW